MSTCKDCLHIEVCKEYHKMFWGSKSLVDSQIDETEPENCQYFKDCSRFVELPEVGNTIFEIHKINSFGDYRIQELKVTNKIIDTNGVAFEIGLLGKRFFTSLEEAEQAIERKKNEALGVGKNEPIFKSSGKISEQD